MSATWSEKYPNERARDVDVDSGTIRVCAGFNKQGLMIWRDIPKLDESEPDADIDQEFHDDRRDDKAEIGSWSGWRLDQQREYFPGVGR